MIKAISLIVYIIVGILCAVEVHGILICLLIEAIGGDCNDASKWEEKGEDTWQ